jgi:hypothetical protein
MPSMTRLTWTACAGLLFEHGLRGNNMEAALRVAR